MKLFSDNNLSTSEALSKLADIVTFAKAEIGLDEFPKQIMEKIVTLFRPDIACFYLRAGNRDMYVREVGFPAEFWLQNEIRKKFDRRPGDKWAIGKAVRTREVVFVRNPKSEELENNYTPFDPRVNQEVVIPIVAQRTILGSQSVAAVVVLSKFDDRVFSADELRLVTIVKTVISIVYNNSLSGERKETHIRILKSMTNIDRRDIDGVFNDVLEALSCLYPIRFISLWLYDEMLEVLVLRSFFPRSTEKVTITFSSFDKTTMYCSQSLSGKSISSLAPIKFVDVSNEPLFSNPAFAQKQSLTWFISFPVLNAGNKPLGVINVWPFGDPEDFDSSTIEAFWKYVNHLADGVMLAILYFEESLISAYDSFFENMIRFEDHRAAWDELALLISNQMKCEACSIFLQRSDGLLALRGSTGIVGKPSYDEVLYRLGEGLTGFTFEKNEPVVYYPELKHKFRDIHGSKYREILKTSFKSKSIVLVPILGKNDIPIGVLRCNNKEESPSRHNGRFTREDVVQLRSVSKAIASIYAKVSFMNNVRIEQESNINSLHHEMLSPVDGISAHVKWLKRYAQKHQDPSPWDNDRVNLKFEDLVQNGKLIEILVKTMGRVEEDLELHCKEHSFYDILKTCRAFLTNEARLVNLQIHVDFLGISKIQCDELQMMRVFYNLLRNSIKYLDKKETNRYVRVTAMDEGSTVSLRFVDNGIGVVKGEEEIIFERLKRGSNARRAFPQGSGLGLDYCRTILAKHGGSIQVDPESLSKPTVFIMHIPKRQK